MSSRGVHLVSHTSDMLDAVMDASDESTKRVIMLGDVKDSVPGSNRQEYREIPVFCDKLLENFEEVHIVRGNHDVSIEEFVPGRVRLHPATGTVIDGVGLAHGHTWPSDEVMAAGTLVLGHEHPTVLFRGRVGDHLSEPCWLRGKFRTVDGSRYKVLPDAFIVLPAFNRLLGGSPVNVIGCGMLSPVLNSDIVDLDGAEIFLLDGVNIGRRSDLMVKDVRYARWDDEMTSPRHSVL